MNIVRAPPLEWNYFLKVAGKWYNMFTSDPIGSVFEENST